MNLPRVECSIGREPYQLYNAPINVKPAGGGGGGGGAGHGVGI